MAESTGDATDTGGKEAGSARTGAEVAKKLPPTAKRKVAVSSKAAGHGTSSGSRRYTAPIPSERKGPSPRWVPVLMFTLWIVGLLLIVLNYMGVLPGSDDGGNGWYLVAGLGSILLGIITATQYR